MDLKSLSDRDLHLQTKHSVIQEKKATVLVLKFLEEVHRRKLFTEYGYSTLIKYMVSELGYSEAESWVRIQAMKLILELPAVEKKIECGTMSLTNAATLKEVLNSNPTRKNEIISLALENAELPSRPFRKLLDPEIREKRIVLSIRLLLKMDKILNGRTEIELIESLVDEKIQSLRFVKNLRAPKKLCSNSRIISKSVQRQTFLRSDYQCEFVDKNGHRCQEKRNLQYDHIHPHALGGKSSEANIRLLCSGHNQRRAFKTFQ
jgi:hypothetical protein